MRVLISGNMGYVGSVLSRHLRRRFPQAEIAGFDSGLFAHCLTAAPDLPERQLDAQYFGDVRDFPRELLRGVDAVVHLAAVSNDPMGSRFEAVTDEINHLSSVRLAELARDAGVKHFTFASSCSVYGFAQEGARTETDSVNPLTAYAKSKIATENGLRQMELGEMTVTCLRFATACGMSDRLRLDLVLNDFVACALATGEISVLSDGTPWRPLIDVADMARAIEWSILRPPSLGGQVLIVNAGSDQWNYQVKELAEAVGQEIPGLSVSINTAAPPDRRSYRVDFAKFRRLAPDHQPVMTLPASIRRLRAGLSEMGFCDRDFRVSQFIRLQVLARQISAGQIDANLYRTAAAEELSA